MKRVREGLFLVIMLLSGLLGQGQSIITDTIYLNFQPDTLIPSDFTVLGITDNRKVNPRLVSYSQIKKYILIPVDQELCLHQPLASMIESGFNSVQGSADTFYLGMNYFIIEQANGRLYNPYILKADFPVYTVQNGDTLPAGTLVYNYKYQADKSRRYKTAVCEDMLGRWNVQFKLDLLQLNNYFKNGNPPPVVWIDQPSMRSHFLNTTVAGVAGINFWQIDGEIYFTRPETDAKNTFVASIIRYQHTNDFDMIGFGKKSEHYYKRLNEFLTLDVNSNIILGLLKWKESENIKLYQLFNFSLSSAQCICYDRINRSSWLFKAGLYENVYYTIKKSVRFQPGIYVGAGYKF